MAHVLSVGEMKSLSLGRRWWSCGMITNGALRRGLANLSQTLNAGGTAESCAMPVRVCYIDPRSLAIFFLDWSGRFEYFSLRLSNAGDESGLTGAAARLVDDVDHMRMDEGTSNVDY
jgi:hypothetical protein